MENNAFGDFLYEYRAKNKLSVQNLHKITGVSQPYLSQLENGSKVPSRKIVDRIAQGIANNDKNDIKEIHNKLLRLAGYSEINYVDSFLDLLNPPSLNSFNEKLKGGVIGSKVLNFPINDLYFHLADGDNKKMFKTLILSDGDREYITKMIESYLVHKYMNIEDGDNSNAIEILTKKSFKFPTMNKEGE